MPASMTQIRPFKSQDQEAVLSLIENIMQEEFQGEETAYPLDDLRNIEQAYHGRGEIFFVAEEGKRIIGTVAIKKEDGRVALLRRLFVEKNYRKKKVGHQLMDQALRFCKQDGYEEVVFKATSKMEAARQICQKAGFSQRAKIQLGPIELFKMTLSLSDGIKKNHA